MRHLLRSLALASLTSASLGANALDLHGPAGSVSFGALVKVLPNGNFVVADPSAGPVIRAGAVYLYRADATLISTIRGDREYDSVGSGAITVLDDGNFLIVSSSWHAGTVRETGAVTWVNGTTGLSGIVSSANSLIGTYVAAAPYIPSQYSVFPLHGGDYYLVSPAWTDDSAVPAKGAFLWATGGSPLTGTMSAANALVGSRRNDGQSMGVVMLTNGNLVVANSSWSTDDAGLVGAATFFSRTSRPVGPISSANSLVGSQDLDGVNTFVVALANGNYVVDMPFWSRGSVPNVGSVTWADGRDGIRGVVSEETSLVGRHANDTIGFPNVAALANGNYVIASRWYDSDDVQDVGAATWVDGSHQSVGEIGGDNSLTGSSAHDGEGMSVIALANGNYVVANATWSNAGIFSAGAVTWADGARATTGVVSTANSLVGTLAYGSVGLVTPLANGNYVVSAPYYDNLRGAVQWMDGRAAARGTFPGPQVIEGAQTDDQVGAVFALSDGNYVVGSPRWSDGTRGQVGAVTWADGSRPTAAIVSAANSLIGSHEGDRIGGCDDQTFCPHVTVVDGGGYLVSSPKWDSDSGEDAGAITWLAGHGPASGVVSKSNSLVGASAQEGFGYAWPALFDGGTAIFVDSGYDQGYGLVVPRHLGAAMVGIVGGGDNDVRGGAYSGGTMMTFDYDARSGMLVVGDPDANVVTLRHLSSPTVPGHSRHARPPR